MSCFLGLSSKWWYNILQVKWCKRLFTHYVIHAISAYGLHTWQRFLVSQRRFTVKVFLSWHFPPQSCFLFQGVLTMKLTHFQPRYVLLLPLDQTKHEQRLQAVGNLSNTQVQFAVDRTNLYQHMHQNRPGFFDRSIDTSKLACWLIMNLASSMNTLKIYLNQILGWLYADRFIYKVA